MDLSNFVQNKFSSGSNKKRSKDYLNEQKERKNVKKIYLYLKTFKHHDFMIKRHCHSIHPYPY